MSTIDIFGDVAFQKISETCSPSLNAHKFVYYIHVYILM